MCDPVSVRGHRPCQVGRAAGETRRIVPWVVGLLVGWHAVAVACNVPVFRFALERWKPDAYQLAVVHRGPLPAGIEATLQPFREAGGKTLTNVALRELDVAATPADAATQALAADPSLQLPMLVVRYPAHLQIEAPVWKGILEHELVGRLHDSPARRELVSRLVNGETAVWVYVETGQPELDNPQVAFLEAELAKLEKELKLPELTDSPDDALLSSAPLRIDFSVLRVRRDDPAEQALVQMLIRSEADLATTVEPLVFPVFGRGRALFPFVGKGINADNVREAASFLVGPCSCQVKELNPGFDLLLTADWDDLLAQEGITLTAVASNERVGGGPPELIPIPSGKQGDALKATAEPTVPSAPAEAPPASPASPAAPPEATGTPPEIEAGPPPGVRAIPMQPGPMQLSWAALVVAGLAVAVTITALTAWVIMLRR